MSPASSPWVGGVCTGMPLHGRRWQLCLRCSQGALAPLQFSHMHSNSSLAGSPCLCTTCRSFRLQRLTTRTGAGASPTGEAQHEWPPVCCRSCCDIGPPLLWPCCRGPCVDVHAPGVQVLSAVSTSDTAIQVRRRLTTRGSVGSWCRRILRRLSWRAAEGLTALRPLLHAEQDRHVDGNPACDGRGGPVPGAAPGGLARLAFSSGHVPA